MSIALADVREALRAKLAAAYEPEVTVTAYMKRNPGTRHMQVMGPDAVDYQMAQRGALANWTVIVQAFSGSPEDVAAQKRLDTWIDPASATSVRAVIAADQTLGVAGLSANVTRCSGYREYDLSNRGDRTLGAEFTLDIYTQ